MSAVNTKEAEQFLSRAESQGRVWTPFELEAVDHLRTLVNAVRQQRAENDAMRRDFKEVTQGAR